MPGWSPVEISEQQRKDPELNFIIEALENESDRPRWHAVSSLSSSAKSLWRMWERLSIEDKVLVRTWYDDEKSQIKQIVVPKSRCAELIHFLHDIPTGGHLGAEKTLEKIRQSFYWSGMKEDIQNYCKRCDQCASRKPTKPTKSPLGSSLSRLKSALLIFLDHFQKLPLVTHIYL